ncbi:N-acetyltransferase [Galactobacter valiniphilus]|uniref:N-acetyltransferase n=1 Tax=Galactobacter valiniphilus TaxID=2676122 RepID=A0A399JFZ5_9MICC|nr:GNAT family N-acetyltransferase [Galactobacter valiniphilus]RII41396.1 N-acetyltransferase [Galactobacter valiniphilus]
MHPDSALPLVTPRLVLRRRVPGDAALVHALWEERDPRVPAHRRLDAEGHPSEAELAEAIALEPVEAGRGLLSVMTRHDGAVIGYCGLLAGGVPERPEAVEISYELLASVRGRGYATEAARAVLAWGEASGLGTVWATVREWNEASLGVASRLGFERTGVVETDADHGDSLLLRRG